jgi:hypothetical protein
VGSTPRAYASLSSCFTEGFRSPRSIAPRYFSLSQAHSPKASWVSSRRRWNAFRRRPTQRGVVSLNGSSSVLGIVRSGKAFIIKRSKSGQVGEIRISVMTLARCFSKWTLPSRSVSN